MKLKKNRVVETPHSLKINGHLIPFVTEVKIHNPNSIVDKNRVVTVTLLADSYKFKSGNKQGKHFSDHRHGYWYTLRANSFFQLLLKAWLRKGTQILMARSTKAVNRKKFSHFGRRNSSNY